MQLNNSIKKQEGDFAKEVEAALSHTSADLEKIESYNKYQELVNLKLKGKYRSLLQSEFMNVIKGDELISVKDTTIKRNGKEQKFLIITGKTVDSITGLTAEHKVVARDISQLKQVANLNDVNLIEDDTTKLGKELNDKLENRLMSKVNMVNDFLVEVFRENIYLNAEMRVDPYLIDSLIRHSLDHRQIKTKFNFTVYDDGNPVDFNKVYPRNYDPSSTDVTFSTTLFDTDLIKKNMVLAIVFPKKKSFILKEIWGVIGASVALLLLIVCAFYLMIYTLLQQKRLSTLKSDFVNNMTHELKTPISTISLACEALNDPDVPNDPIYVKMIDEENKRLGGLVESILQSAIIDRGELKLKLVELDFYHIITNSIGKSKLRILDANGKVETDLQEGLMMVADPIHMTNIILNLIDNSLKYSKDAPLIKIKSWKQHGHVFFSIQDNGIGMEKEHLPRIFEKLYRIPTGNRHDVKGFGLGLTYVKAVVDKHHGEITVKSKLNEGTTFTLKFKSHE
jgi:two-component system phosphate regulon sensor histidine kinase PhoR